MDEFSNFLQKCQYKNSNSSIIILPNVINTHQLLSTYNLATKHAVVLCHYLLLCWRNQAGWLGEQCPKLDSMLSRPLGAKMVELDYNSTGKTLCLSKDGLKSTLINLEQAKLLKRVLIKNKWYVLLYDEAFKLYLNNNKNKKHRINKGNIICTSWLSTLKTDNGQTDFTGALILGEITYFSRVFRRKQPSDDQIELNAFDESDRTVKTGNAGNNYSDTNQNCNDAAIKNKDNVVLVSKSKGLVAYFEYNHFKKKFLFLSSKVIDRTLSRLEKSNVISVERKKFTRGRKVIKRLYITLNYDLIQKGVNKTIVDFVFKTDDYLTKKQLTSFCHHTPPFIYNKYNNKTIIYPKQDFSNNFVSFSSLSSGKCFTTSDIIKPPEQTISKKWYQVTYLSTNIDQDNKHEKYAIYDATRCSETRQTESHCSKKRAFRLPRYLRDMQSSLKRHYRAYFAIFDYPISFCYQLLESLSRKYPDALFRGENQFITYFRKILSQEKRASWLVKSRKYFYRALSLAELAYEKLPILLRDKLNKLAVQAGKRIEDLPALLSGLAIRKAKHMFACVSSFLSYMKQVLLRLKSKEEIQEAYKALPRVKIAEVARYLNSVEASYHRTGPQEHLRRKIASTLPMTIAYYLLYNCNFYSARVDKDKNFVIPSKNKNWVEMLRGGIKNIIKDQVSAVYGTIKAIKFVGYLRKENIQSGEKVEIKATSNAHCYGDKYDETYSSYDASKTQSFKDKSAYKKEPISYHLFQQKRLEEEQKEKEKLEAKMREEEKELKSNGVYPEVYPEVYEKYKQVVEETEIEKKRYIQRGGEKERAKELYKMLSFSEWMQLQELVGMV